MKMVNKAMIIRDRYGYEKEYINPNAKSKREILIADSSKGAYFEAWYSDNPNKIIGRSENVSKLFDRMKKKSGNIRVLY